MLLNVLFEILSILQTELESFLITVEKVYFTLVYPDTGMKLFTEICMLFCLHPHFKSKI